MSDVFLVYSPSEDLWPAEGDIHVLGQWCLPFGARETWSARKFRLSADPWEDRRSHHDFNQFLVETYEDLIVELAGRLNEIHHTNHSLRFWKIVAGWWLYRFIQITHHRWLVLSGAAEEYETVKMKIRVYGASTSAPKDSLDFHSSIEESWWNERLFRDLATFLPNVSFEEIDISGSPAGEELGLTPLESGNLENKHQGKLGKKKKSKLRNTKVLFTDDFLAPAVRLRLELAVGQLPRRRGPRPPKVLVKPRSGWREWRLGQEDSPSYASVLGRLIPLYLPVSFLEGYRAWNDYSAEVFSDVDPEVIMTANAHYADDAWKYFAAGKTENGARLVIQQHGGFYGTAAISPSEYYETSISDRFLSWGWKADSSPKVWPAPAGRLVGAKSASGKSVSCKLLLVLTTVKYPPTQLDSSPIGSQFEKYVEDQFNFVKTLNDAPKNSLVVRDYPASQHFWDLRDRFFEKCGDVTFEPPGRKFVNSLSESRLAIMNNNFTTYLQSFSMGVPTVVFWNPEHWELSQRARRHFEVLRQANVFFEDGVSCARHVNEIWGHERDWWESSPVKQAVESFSQEFAYLGRKPIRELKAALMEW